MLNEWDLIESPVPKKISDSESKIKLSAHLSFVCKEKWSHSQLWHMHYIYMCGLLLQCCEKAVEARFVTGNHVTMLDSKETVTVINRQVANAEALKTRDSLIEQHTLY